MPQNSNEVISKLETKLFLPVYVFYSLATSVTVKNIKDYSGDAYLGARCCFLSVIFSMVTIPALYYLMATFGII